jgi:Uma2 family endonuclease
MPTTTTPAQEHQERWQEIIADPSLRDLPYKVETTATGQIVLSPHSAEHARRQKHIETRLDSLLESGEAFSEYPIVTTEGTKQADVIWASDQRLEEMVETGDPPTLAPEICVEVLSPSNKWENIRKKIGLYLEAGAEEVWVVDTEQHVRFFSEEELEHSEIAPGFPSSL